MTLTRVAGYRAPSKVAVKFVLDILKEKPGLTTKEIYNRARSFRPSQSSSSSTTLDDGPVLPSVSYDIPHNFFL